MHFSQFCPVTFTMCFEMLVMCTDVAAGFFLLGGAVEDAVKVSFVCVKGDGIFGKQH